MPLKFIKKLSVSSQPSLLFLLTLFSISCENKSPLSYGIKNYEVKEIHFSIDSTISKESNTIQYFEEDENSFLAVFNKPTNEIIWFDFVNGHIVNKTKLHTQGPNSIGKPFGIHVKSLDSVFVLSSATYRLSMINLKGEILNTYQLFNGELDYRGYPNDSENSIKPILQSTNPLLVFSDSIVALAGLPDANPLNPDFYDSKVYIKLNLTSGAINYQIPYPERYRNKLWGLYHSFPFHTFNENTGKAIISFPASDKIYLTDLLKTDSLSVPSTYMEEPSSWKEAEANGLKMMKFFVQSPSFYRISYDSYRKLYYKFSLSPSKEDLSGVDMAQLSVVNFKTTYLSILDEDFNLLQEILLPKKYDPRFVLVSPNGLCIAKKNENENQLTFGVFEGFEE